ncbi:DUF488 family protein [Hyphococcus flavus]|uniref:DUF488 family protein n=1 Tax=Hyphococcus flavus TaxID=1866326 RepID=A0AAF0CGV0_9PROT|nr:DUF488 family protein [Hyphococcus flavus]WDI32683.1 DUF488 family protein [Hyphococcus flavus]
MKIKLKRAYEAPVREDGKRILVERLWPRGVTKGEAALDDWFKEIAPSPQLRKWYGHEPARWPEFQKRYRAELEANKDEVARLHSICKNGTVTFVYAAKDEERNSAAVLKAFLESI